MRGKGPAQGNGCCMIYSETTRNIRVSVEPVFLPDRSDPTAGRFIWAYHVRIENAGPETVRLMTRHWRIVDATGRTHEVRGPGVVGEQPTLKPGEVFEYTSGTPLSAPSGIMAGSYGMETGGGESFDVTIPAFSLDSPHQPRQLH